MTFFGLFEHCIAGDLFEAQCREPLYNFNKNFVRLKGSARCKIKEECSPDDKTKVEIEIKKEYEKFNIEPHIHFSIGDGIQSIKRILCVNCKKIGKERLVCNRPRSRDRGRRFQIERIDTKPACGFIEPIVNTELRVIIDTVGIV